MQLEMYVDQKNFTRRMMLKGRGTYAPVRCGDGVHKFCELVHLHRPAPRREHIISKLGNVAPSVCKGIDKPSRDVKCSRFCWFWRQHAVQRTLCCG